MSSTTSLKASTARCEVKIKAPYVARPFCNVGTNPRLSMCWRTVLRASGLNLCSRTGTKTGAYPWLSQVKNSSSYVSVGTDLVLSSRIGVFPRAGSAILWLSGEECLPGLSAYWLEPWVGRQSRRGHPCAVRGSDPPNLSIICPQDLTSSIVLAWSSPLYSSPACCTPPIGFSTPIDHQDG